MVQRDLTLIKTYFKILSQSIEKLETCGMLLSESLALLNEVECQLKTVPEDIGHGVNDKFKSVLQRNPGYNAVNSVNKYLKGECLELPEEIPPNIACQFKYCLVISVDVQRSFSAYKLPPR